MLTTTITMQYTDCEILIAALAQYHQQKERTPESKQQTEHLIQTMIYWRGQAQSQPVNVPFNDNELAAAMAAIEALHWQHQHSLIKFFGWKKKADQVQQTYLLIQNGRERRLDAGVKLAAEKRRQQNQPPKG